MAKILVVDDDGMNLRIAARILKTAGMEVILAKSGYDAIELLKENKVELVLLDIEMPQMNGFETLEQIRHIPEIADTRVMFLTGTVDEDTINKTKELNSLGCIKKPLVPQNLTDMVKSVI